MANEVVETCEEIVKKIILNVMTALPIQPALLIQIYYWGIFLFCLFMYFSYAGSNNCDKLLEKNSMVPSLFFTIVLIFFMGLRPVTFAFGDTINYAVGYARATGLAEWKIDMDEEWLFNSIMLACKASGMTVSGWFFIIEIGYLGFILLAMKKLIGENPWMGMLFFLSAFSTFTFGTNGIRNGLACSIITFAFALAVNKNIAKMVIPGFIAILAMGIHKSIALPIAAFLAASFVIKNPMIAIYFWVASIGISLVAGGTVSNFFMGLGFDDRMTQYSNGMGEFGDQFTQTGFRWDFLLYSAMPVWMTWYVSRKAQKERALYGDTLEEAETGITGAGRIADADSMRIFNILATTYILANSFWVMVIKAAFSNRFAYLSWFLYPVVLAYAVVRLHIWPDQDRKAALILLAHAGFTLFMFILGKL